MEPAALANGLLQNYCSTFLIRASLAQTPATQKKKYSAPWERDGQRPVLKFPASGLLTQLPDGQMSPTGRGSAPLRSVLTTVDMYREAVDRRRWFLRRSC